MGLSWNFFVARRGINVAEFFKKNNIRTYDEFVELLAGRGVDAPSEASVSDLFVKHAIGASDLWDAFRPPRHDTENEADQAPAVIEKDQDEQTKKEQPVTIAKKNKAVAKPKQKKKAPKLTAQKAKSKAKTTTKKKRIPTKS